MPVPARFGEACGITSKFTIFYAEDFIFNPFSDIPTNHRARRGLVLAPPPSGQATHHSDPASGSSRQGRAHRSGGDDQSIAEARLTQHADIGDGDTNIPRLRTY